MRTSLDHPRVFFRLWNIRILAEFPVSERATNHFFTIDDFQQSQSFAIVNLDQRHFPQYTCQYYGAFFQLSFHHLQIKIIATRNAYEIKTSEIAHRSVYDQLLNTVHQNPVVILTKAENVFQRYATAERIVFSEIFISVIDILSRV
jgi:hypothetical protein